MPRCFGDPKGDPILDNYPYELGRFWRVRVYLVQVVEVSLPCFSATTKFSGADNPTTHLGIGFRVWDP